MAAVVFELILVSPLLLLWHQARMAAVRMAPDVFCHCRVHGAGKRRRILLCIDPTSFSSISWTARDFLKKDLDHVIVLHVNEPTEAFQIPTDQVRFDAASIDTKDFYIPQYMSEFCHWLGQNGILYEGVIVRLDRGHNVAETILKLSQSFNVDSVVASASQRMGTTDIGNVAFQVALKSDRPTVIVK
jgi:hypothetical protein